MNMLLFFLIIIPILCAIILAFMPEKYKSFKDVFFIIAIVFNMFAVCFYFGKSIFSYLPWAAFDFSFSIVMTRFSEFLLVIIAFFALLTAIFSISNMKDNPRSSISNLSILLAIAFVNGAIMTDSLIFMLLFVEALAIPFILMILSSKENTKKLAVKAFTITAFADLFFMMGIGLVFALTKTMNISEISLKLANPLEITAFIFIIIGAAGKLGIMPFHSWMPEASEKAPVPFMVFIATAAEKILGVYIVLIALKMFNITEFTSIGGIIMTFAAISAVLAALLANSQSSFKKMLVYTSISQGSFMLIALISAHPIAIAGAILHLFAHTTYKSSLFFGAGIMDNAKTEIISYKNNPYLFLSFILAIASFIGVPLFAAFYSKELVYEGVLHSGMIWYIIMLLVTFFCSTAVLNWLGKIFFGNKAEFVKYPVLSMIPAITTALLCLFFGIFRNIPLTIIKEYIPFEIHSDIVLIIVSAAMLFIVLINFIIGYSKYKNGLGFVKKLISALGINKINDNEDADPYNIVINIYKNFGKASFEFDRGLNRIYDSFIVNTTLKCSSALKRLHSGSMSLYIVWVLLGIALIIIFFR